MIEQIKAKEPRVDDLSSTDFATLAKIAKKEFGLDLATSKKTLVGSRLTKRVRNLGLKSLHEYIGRINSELSNDERDQLAIALTTNVTSFFRELHHFETLESVCIPIFRNRNLLDAPIRIWSAGCSSGQEPYSIAMSLLEKLPEPALQNTRVLATDIDTTVIEHAKKGVYPLEAIEDLKHCRDYHHIHKSGDSITISPRVRSLVRFAHLNLISNWSFEAKFDAIFCRNVAIYFDSKTQSVLWKKLAESLRNGGYLFIGHSERITGPALDNLSPNGITTYQRRQ
ncbi:protein-glutamate O-methyltransferase CheR [Cognatishimia sp. F0-27]|uniref:CheR family methyltransferase n=1 Tax=Cognatishimia sp. F0-27 TaxID=2816855 RepID=UPI001D0C34CD|nr:protein-glutamate O-methyltransferase [Cognatishimia sp. F0-27]MCC1492055.1 protein-glutamate O-methyltransferase [Cognatishimia sp. F0-27]